MNWVAKKHFAILLTNYDRRWLIDIIAAESLAATYKQGSKVADSINYSVANYVVETEKKGLLLDNSLYNL